MFSFIIKIKNLVPSPASGISAPKSPIHINFVKFYQLLNLRIKNQKNSKHRFVIQLTELIPGSLFFPKNPSTRFFTKKKHHLIQFKYLSHCSMFWFFRISEKAHFGPLPGQKKKEKWVSVLHKTWKPYFGPTLAPFGPKTLTAYSSLKSNLVQF